LRAGCVYFVLGHRRKASRPKGNCILALWANEVIDHRAGEP
jgi:hypothetical protein